MTDRVVRCDLRPHRQARAALQEVGRLLADESQADIRLLLVIDSPAALTEHALAYEALWRSRRVSKLLGVLVGPLTLPSTLEVPGSIGSDRDSGIIWVSDPVGVDWEFSAATVVGAHPGEKGESGLTALVDILSAPAMFVRVVGLIAGVPERVVSPGLRIFETTANQTMFLAALSASIGRLLDADAADTAASLALASDASQASTAVRSTVVPGSRLASVKDSCTAEAQELTETARALGSAAALYGSEHLGARARDLAAGVGAGLREYRTAVQILVSTPPGERAGRLRDWGVQPAARGTAGPDDISSMINSALEAGQSLPLLSRRLRDHERELRAHGDSTDAERIERVCSRVLEDRFAEPAPMTGPQPWLVAAGGVAVALAALGYAFGIVGGIVTAVAWLGLTGLTIVRGPGGRLADHRGPLVAGGIAAAAGLAVGIVIAQVLRPPNVAGAIGIVAGLGIALATVTWSWRVRARRWDDALRTQDVLVAADGLTEVVTAAASREWSAAATRQDALIRARSAMAGAASALRTYQAKLDRDLARSPVRPRSQPEFDTFIGRILTRLIRLALQPTLGTLTSSPPQEQEERALSGMTHLLQAWEQHVDVGHSPLEPPGFVGGENTGRDALSDDDIDAIKDTIMAEPREVMWQLCRAHDISLLDSMADQMTVLRFAPVAARPALGTALAVQAEWLSSATRAGILRFVPMRRGVVRRTWSTAGDLAEQDPTSGLPVTGNPMDGRART